MPVLVANGIEQSYGTRSVLSGVDVALEEGVCVGLVGGNGAGKSTLIRILAGAEKPDAGEVIPRGDARIAVLDQAPIWERGQTALQAAMSGLVAWTAAIELYQEAADALAKECADLDLWLEKQGNATTDIERLGGFDREHDARAMLDRLNIQDPDQDVSTMSGGEQRRVALARALMSRADLLILDEPTNHLDVETIEWLEKHLTRDQPGAVLLVTHDRYFLDRIAQTTLEISQGRLYRYDGGYSAYLEAKAERMAHEDRVESNRQNFLRRELEWLRRSPSARRTKQKARIQRAHAAIDTKAPTRDKTLELAVETVRSGSTILNLEELSVGIAGTTLIDSLTLYLTKGERVGIVGPNGSGKTTLLRTLLGEVPALSGEFTLGQNTKISYLGQNRDGLDLEKTVAENVAESHSHVHFRGQDINVRSYLEKFLFTVPQQKQPVNALSGGEKTRVLLAKLLLQPANLLILDEPTNDLDVPTIASLEQMLIDMKATALVVTHDRYFLDRIATAILAFEGDRQIVRYEGNYSAYRTLKAQSRSETKLNKAPESRAASAPAPASSRAASKAKKLTYAERLELEQIVDVISTLEEQIATLELELADPELYTNADGTKAKDATDTLARTRAELEGKLSRWTELEERGEQTD